MRQRELFARLACFVCGDALTAAERAALECCLRDGGAELAEDASAATHIVCHPTLYTRFLPRRNERFVAIVRPEWVFKSFLLQTLVSADRFSADPALIFSALVISAGPIDKDPRKVIDGLIAHFGGQIVESESDAVGATHVLALDEQSQPEEPPVHRHWLHLSFTDSDVLRSVQTWKKWLLDRPASLEFALPSCVVAWLGKATGLSDQHHVTYAWIEDCVRRKTRVPEGAFSNKTTAVDGKPKKAPSWKTRPETQIENIGLAACARVYQSTKSDPGGVDLTLARRSSAERAAALQEMLSGAIVLLAQHIPPALKERISDVLKAAKAKVANVPLGDSYEDIVKKVVANASFVVCRYQAGFEYEEAVRQDKRIVSIYWVLAGHSVHDDAQSPFQEAISRPVKSFGGIPGMQGFVITLSGYSSRTTPTREDVQIAIHATGACMLPVFSRTHSTHLLCYEPKGEKFKKAQSWLFENIVGHEWLFQCLSKWELVSEDVHRYALPKSSASAGPPTDATTTVDASDATNDSRQLSTASSATAAAATPRTKLANARFDVDDILTELNETTPSTKPGEAGTEAAATGKGGAKTKAKDIACKLFDTPTAESKAQGKEESSADGKKTTTKSSKRSSNDAPEQAEPRSSKRRATAASAKTSPSKREPDNEDDVRSKTEMVAKGRKDTAAKKASTALVQASTDALEALSGGAAAKKATAAASSKRKRDHSPHEDGGDSTDSTDAHPPPQTAEQPARAAAKSKKAKASAAPVDASKAKSESLPAAAEAKEASPSKSSSSNSSSAAAKDSLTAPAKKSAAAANTSGGRKRDIVFLLTGTREETAVNESIIAALGGTASQTGRKFDHSSTHIICSELKRTEKFVAGCAGGKWILKPSYLEASSAAGRFVDEEPHEWGAGEDDTELMDPRIWPQAAAFWRKARAEGQPGALAGWRFLVHPKCVPPPEMCERIVEAGDGLVVQLAKSLDLAALAASAANDEKPLLALVPGELPTRDPWLKKFGAQKIECVNASFLIDYITKDQARRPKPESYRV